MTPYSPQVEVFRVAQQAKGHKSNEWGQKAFWSGRLTIVQQGEVCTIRLLDRTSGKEFAQAPVNEGYVTKTK